MEKQEKIRICTSHQDFKTPLVWTFAFNGSEYWCPYCGKNEGMMGAGVLTESTPRLRNRLKRFEKLSKEFLNARSASICQSLIWEGKRISPSELPQEEKDRLRKIVRDWKYKQKPLSNLKSV